MSYVRTIIGAVTKGAAKGFGLKTFAVVGAGAVLVGGLIGWQVRDAFCDAAALRVRNASLEATNKAHESNDRLSRWVQRVDEHLYAIGQQAAKKNEKEIHETPVNATACLDDAATRRVRNVR